MLDSDLAEFYGVKTNVLNQAVKRNKERFPEDFMFQLKKEEYTNLTSQIVISRWGGRRTLPFVFTEHGVAMLSSVLKSQRAVQINISIIRAFIRIREYLTTHKQILEKLRQHDENFMIIFNFLKELRETPKKQISEKRFGFKPDK